MIYRTDKQTTDGNGKLLHPYIMVDNRCADDLKLSNGAFGLLIRILRNIDTWEFSEENLAEKTGTGITELRSQLKELIKYNYVYRKRYYEKGRFKKYVYTIYEFPNDFELEDDSEPFNGL